MVVQRVLLLPCKIDATTVAVKIEGFRETALVRSLFKCDNSVTRARIAMLKSSMSGWCVQKTPGACFIGRM